MNEPFDVVALELMARWGWRGAQVIGVATLVFGIWSAAAPRRSIALYQWIMTRFNWRVEPLDEPREVRNTRCLGVLMTLLSVALLVRLFSTKL